MPGGRPTKLTEELVEKAKHYLEELKLGGLYHGDIASDYGLAIYLGISRDSIYEWAKKDTPLAKAFSDTLKDIEVKQGYTLFNKGLKGELNPTITKMMLNVNHGMVERSVVDSNIKGDVSFVNAVPRPTRDGDTGSST